MNNNEFRDAVYEKYAQYQRDAGKTFVKKGFGKSGRSILTISLMIAMVAILVLGTTAAGYYFSSIWKEPEQYDYNQELEITDEMKSEALPKETLFEKAKAFLVKIGVAEETIQDYKLINDPQQNKTSWEITTSNGSFLYLDGKTGKLERYSAKDLQKEYAETERTEAEAAGTTLIMNLGMEKDRYSVAELRNDGGGRWWMDCYRTYDGVLNPYQGVRLLFAPSEKEILLVRIFDDPFENNPYYVSHAEALFIANEYWGERELQEIKAEKAIEKMNALLYQKENEGSWRTEQIVRNVWKVTATWKESGYKEQLYIDGTTGELIGGDQTK